MTDVETIKERLPLAELVGRKVTLARSGRNLRGLCPFHSEKTPSFFVFPESNTYKCFGCGEGGDLFSFLMKTENMEFREALTKLAGEAGVEIRTLRSSADRSALDRIKMANSAAAEYFHATLIDDEKGAQALQYARGRGIDDATLRKFRIGYAPDAWESLVAHLRATGFNDPEILAAGLARQGDRTAYDTFRNRLMFPIADLKGEVVGFGGRALGDDPAKYMNTPRTGAFDKGAVLYGLHLARQSIERSGTVVVVEGYMDAVAAHQHGFANVVASMGTSITPAQAGLLRGVAKRLILCLDADAAGAAATRRGLELLSREGGVRGDPFDMRTQDLRSLVQYESWLDRGVFVASLPEGKDPDDVIRTDVDAWERALEEAAPLADHMFTSLLGEVDPESRTQMAEALDRLAPFVQQIRQPVVRRLYVARLASALGMLEQDVERRVERRERPSLKRRLDVGRPEARPLDDFLLARGLDNPAFFAQVAPELSAEDFASTENRLLADTLSRIGARAVVGEAEDPHRALDPALLDRLESIEELRHRLPPLEGDSLIDELRGIALRMRRERLRSENRKIQRLHSERSEFGSEDDLARWQRRILAEMRDVDVALRRLHAGRIG